MNQSIRGAVYLSIAAAIWGGVYVVSKVILETVPPFTLMFFRYLVAGGLLIVLCRRQGLTIFPREDRWAMLQIGIVGYFLSIAAQFIGTKLSSAHLGAVVTSLSPVFQSLFAILLLRERMSVREVVAMTAAFAGVLLIIGGPDMGGEAGIMAVGILLLAAVFWGYYSVVSRKLSGKYSALQITTCGIVLAGLLSIGPAYWEFGSWAVASLWQMSTLLSILYISVAATAIAFFCWNKGLSLVSSHEAGLFFFLQPVVGSLLGWALLGETLTGSFLVGSLLVMIGTFYNLR